MWVRKAISRLPCGEQLRLAMLSGWISYLSWSGALRIIKILGLTVRVCKIGIWLPLERLSSFPRGTPFLLCRWGLTSILVRVSAKSCLHLSWRKRCHHGPTLKSPDHMHRITFTPAFGCPEGIIRCNFENSIQQDGSDPLNEESQSRMFRCPWTDSPQPGYDRQWLWSRYNNP